MSGRNVYSVYIYIFWDAPPPRIPVTNEGLYRSPTQNDRFLVVTDTGLGSTPTCKENIVCKKYINIFLKFQSKKTFKFIQKKHHIYIPKKHIFELKYQTTSSNSNTKKHLQISIPMKTSSISIQKNLKISIQKYLQTSIPKKQTFKLNIPNKNIFKSIYPKKIFKLQCPTKTSSISIPPKKY